MSNDQEVALRATIENAEQALADVGISGHGTLSEGIRMLAERAPSGELLVAVDAMLAMYFKDASEAAVVPTPWSDAMTALWQAAKRVREGGL